MLFGYIIFQFLWWEILLVKQTGQIIELKQKIAELNVADATRLKSEVDELHTKKKMQVMMVVGEGTVFLLLLLFGIYKIKQARDKELQLTNQQKNFFLSITHELKTPIAATKLQLQTLLKHKLDQAQQDELIKNALNETERLNTLIDNLLLANRLDSGEFVFKREKENVSELVESVLNRYYKIELFKGELTFNVQTEIFLSVDKTAFPSIVTNLVDNAFKYSFAEKRVEVVLKKLNDKVVLSVYDQGCGIAEEDKHKIFAKFYRAGNEETRTTKGTGLGLYIVSYLARKHDATVTVKNNQPKGSILEVNFNAL